MVAVAQRTPQQTLRRLTIIVVIQYMGATLGLPLLPLFLERHGGSTSEVGVVMASFFVAGMLTQFGLGHLADKFGRRPIFLSALAVYGLGGMTYIFAVPAGWFALSRAIQGAAAGAIEVTALSSVSALFPESERGRATSRILAAQLFGFAIGPVAGLFATANTLGWAFFVSGVVSLILALVVWQTNLGDQVLDRTPLPPMQWNKQLTGALFGAVAQGLCIGVYEACWTLLMTAHHASSLQIRLSWTVFCLPWVLLSRVGGWLADHANRRFIALAGMLNGAAFMSIYPHIHNTVVMMCVGSFEAVGASLSVPSISSLLSQGAQDREMSRRQGLFTTASTAALALSASVSGVMFSINPALPFTLVAVISALTASTTLWWWRDVRGRIS